MMRRICAVLGLACIALCLSPRPAEAAVSLCNDTSFVLYAAIAFPEGFDIASQGWTRLRPGACVNQTAGDKTEIYFVYAKTAQAHSGPVRAWGGGVNPVQVCVQAGSFSMRMAASAPQCAETDAYRLPFMSIAVKNGTAVTRFSEKRRFAKPADAERAGLQRLLADNGFKLNPEAPYGAASDTALAQFRQRMGISADANNSDLIDRLEMQARASSSPEGYTVCNQGKDPLFVASAVQESGRYISRGWWKVAPSLCARLTVAPLTVPRFYVRAEKSDGTQVLGGTENFCVTDIEFEITGRENCAARGLREMGFAVTELQGKRGYTVRIGTGVASAKPK